MEEARLPVAIPRHDDDLARNFEAIAPHIAFLLPQRDCRLDRNHPNYIGHGKSARVFRVGAFAVRMPHGGDRNLQAWASEYTRPLLAGSNTVGLEQIVGASATQGIVVSYEVLNATPANRLSNEALHNMPQEHVNNLQETLVSLHNRDLVYDAIGDNLLYNQHGFTIIDYSIRNPRFEPVPVTPAETINRMQSYVAEAAYAIDSQELAARHTAVESFIAKLSQS